MTYFSVLYDNKRLFYSSVVMIGGPSRMNSGIQIVTLKAETRVSP